MFSSTGGTMRVRHPRVIFLAFLLSLSAAVPLAGKCGATPPPRPLFAAVYNGPVSGSDTPRAVMCDTSGNILVAGSSDGGSTGQDYALVKWPPAGGAPLWVARYNGLGNGHDRASGLAIDSKGSAVVAGYSDSGSGNLDIAVMKHGPGGANIFTQRYDSPNHAADYAEAVAVDASDNIFVAGHSFGFSDTPDFLALKFTTGGTLAWARSFPSPGADYAAACAVAPDGGFIVAGTSEGAGTGLDILVVKWKANGDLAWSARWDGAAHLDDRAAALCVDSAGNAHVAGATLKTPTNQDMVVVTWNAAGVFQWATTWGGPAGGTDEATAVRVLSGGDIMAAGASAGDGTQCDMTVVRLDPTGVPRFSGRWENPQHLCDYPYALVLDAAENAYLIGYSDLPEGGSAIATVKFSAEGAALWGARHFGETGSPSRGRALTLAPDGSVVVAAAVAHPQTGFDIIALAYSPEGGPPATAPLERLLLPGDAP